MARITKAERERKRAVLDEYIWELFCEKGWEAVTYQKLAEKLGTRKSTIQRYYPLQTDFLDAIVGRALPEIRHLLDTSSIDNFINTWTQSLDIPIIHNYVDLIFIDGMRGLNNRFAKTATMNTLRFICINFGTSLEDAKRIFKYTLGNIIVHTAEQRFMLDEHVLKKFVSSGILSMTNESIAEELSLSKQAVDKFYPKPIDMLEALKGKVYEVIRPELDFSSVVSFLQTWQSALDKHDCIQPSIP